MADEDLSMESIMRLAQQLQGAPPPAVDTTAPDNGVGGLLGRLFGASGPGSGLSTEQQNTQARMALAAAGGSILDAANRPLPYGARRSVMGAISEGARSGFSTSAAYEKEARDLAKEQREERRAQFNDRMSASGMIPPPVRSTSSRPFSFMILFSHFNMAKHMMVATISNPKFSQKKPAL